MNVFCFLSIRFSALMLLLFFLMLSFQVTSQASDFKYEVGLKQQTGFFSRIYDTQHQTGFHIATNRSHGKYMLRMRRGVRFNQTAYQWEMENYPIISDRMYGYIAYAWSNSIIFSEHRAGAEIFSSIPFRSEVSLGMRYMSFKNAPESWILTGSLSHYLHSWLFTVRPYLVFSEDRTGRTITASVRYILNDTGDYIMLRGSRGVSPDQVLFQLGEEQYADVLLLESLQAGLESRYRISERITGQGSIDLYRQELSFDPGNHVLNWVFRFGATYHF